MMVYYPLLSDHWKRRDPTTRRPLSYAAGENAEVAYAATSAELPVYVRRLMPPPSFPRDDGIIHSIGPPR